jgi:hypothetical protein
MARRLPAATRRGGVNGLPAHHAVRELPAIR